MTNLHAQVKILQSSDTVENIEDLSTELYADIPSAASQSQKLF